VNQPTRKLISSTLLELRHSSLLLAGIQAKL
jgi:hypothetical protein